MHPALGSLRLSGHRKLDHKTRSYRRVFFNPNRAAMLFDNAADNRQPQAGAALLGGKVLEKEFFF